MLINSVINFILNGDGVSVSVNHSNVQHKIIRYIVSLHLSFQSQDNMPFTRGVLECCHQDISLRESYSRKRKEYLSRDS